MTIQEKDNNETRPSVTLQGVQDLFTTEAPGLGFETINEGAFIMIIYDDDTLTAQQKAAINSGLAQLGLN